MFNNYARIDDNYEFVMSNDTQCNYVIEMIINAQFATCFDDIYTMHIYQHKFDSNDFIVDVAFDFHTNEFIYDDDNHEYEKMHTYDMRVKMYIENIDIENIVQSIDERKLQFEIIYRNAYETRNYAHSNVF